MKRDRFIIYILAAAILASSCVSHKPYVNDLNTSDYNKRVVARDPMYKKNRSAIGIAVDVGAPVAGAAIGVATSPFVLQSEQGKKNFTVGNAVAGALLGLGVDYIAEKVSGYGKFVKAKDYQKWVKEAFGNDYIFIKCNPQGYLTAINRNAESSYTVKNIVDVQDFAKAFPNSQYTVKMLEQALGVLPREALVDVVELYPNTTLTKDFKRKYITSSQSYIFMEQAVAKYPGVFTDAEVEQMFVKQVKSVNEAVWFNKRYPNSRYAQDVVLNALKEGKLTDPILKELNNIYHSKLPLDKERVRTASSTAKENYYNLMYIVNNPQTSTQIDNFNKSYSWLVFDNKKETMLRRVWDMAYKTKKKGIDVIADAGKIVHQKYAKDIGLTGTYFQEFVQQELEKESDKIKILSQNLMESSSPEFEKWKKSAYSAGVVRVGTLQYLVYGEIKNESRFDVPVAIRSGATVVQTMKIENGGLLGGVLNVLGALTGVETSKKDVLGIVKSPFFIIPLLEAGKTLPYAILITVNDTSFNATSGGVNMFDLVKASSSLSLEAVQVQSKVWYEEMPTDEELKTMNSWLELAYTGLPQAKAVDLFRNKEFKQDTWDDEWSKILRDAANRPSSSSSSSSRSGSNSRDDDDDDDDNVSTTPTQKMHTVTLRLHHKDGSPINCETMHAEWKYGKGDFKVDRKGNVTITWPAEDGDYVDFISFNESFLPDWCKYGNLELLPGKHYDLNVDSMTQTY